MSADTTDQGYRCPRCNYDYGGADEGRQLVLVHAAPNAALIGICMQCLTDDELHRTDPGADLRHSHPTHNTRPEGTA